MIEALADMAKTEGFKEAESHSGEVIPGVFAEMPKAAQGTNIDIPVSVKEIDVNKTIYLITRNESLEGSIHPITGVPFERKIVDTPTKTEGVFPKFESTFDAQIPKDLYEESDKKQFIECNKQLSDGVNLKPSLADRFDTTQLEQIKNGDTPDGYVWHHDAVPGKMQLVDFDIHAQTGHTGGRTVWGGGNENR